MSNTIKLVIEIPEQDVENIKELKEEGVVWMGIEWLNPILKGDPLSEVLTEIREEIKALDEGITSYEHDDPWIYKREALEVIDKHISEERK